MASVWFPTGQSDVPGWRLDVVSLLAVIGESSMAEHSQTLTASWFCCLPRIIPAPQVLLKATRPTRMPQLNAAVVGVKNGTFVQTLNYFPNILHPIEGLPAFAFRKYRVTHSKRKIDSWRKEEVKRGDKDPDHNHPLTLNTSFNSHGHGLPAPVTSGVSTGISVPDAVGIRKRGTSSTIMQVLTRSNEDRFPPHVPVATYSPLNGLSIFSCLLTIGLLVLAIIKEDGVACVALGTISLASSIVGFASMWSPQLMKRNSLINVPDGDVVIRTREGAFIVVKCDENVARELYTGTEECRYTVQNLRIHRVLVGLGTSLLMISVVLLGNCNFPQQLAIGISYIVLNGLYWGMALLPKKKFWDMSLYDFEPITPADTLFADAGDINDPDPEKRPSFTRTMWYAIRETGEIGWVKKSGAAPVTDEWNEWLKEAEAAAKHPNPEVKQNWKAVTIKDQKVGNSEATAFQPASPARVDGITFPGGQEAPDIKVLPNERR